MAAKEHSKSGKAKSSASANKKPAPSKTNTSTHFVADSDKESDAESLPENPSAKKPSAKAVKANGFKKPKETSKKPQKTEKPKKAVPPPVVETEDSSEESNEESDDEPLPEKPSAKAVKANGVQNPKEKSKKPEKTEKPKKAVPPPVVEEEDSSEESDEESDDESLPENPVAKTNGSLNSKEKPKEKSKRKSEEAVPARVAEKEDSSSSSEEESDSEAESKDEKEDQDDNEELEEAPRKTPQDATDRTTADMGISERPLATFQLPPKFKPLPKPSSSSTPKVASLLSKSNVSKKQIFHFTTPASVPINAFKHLTCKDINAGKLDFSHDGNNYEVAEELEGEGGREDLQVMVMKDGAKEYTAAKHLTITKTHHFRLAPITSTSTSSQSRQTIPQKRPARAQPEGLRIRFRSGEFGVAAHDAEKGSESESEDDSGSD